MSSSCIGVPLSHLVLELHALGESDRAAEVEDHLARCSACRSLLDSIRADERQLPALVVPMRARPRRWRWVLALAPAVALAWFAIPRGRDSHGPGIKGGDSSIELVRERAGALLTPDHFTPADRFQVRLSCPPTGRVVASLVVEQGEERFRPLPDAELQCANLVPFPGTFTLEGGAARICLELCEKSGCEEPRRLCQSLLPEP